MVEDARATEAAYYEEGLLVGIVAATDVISWADEIVSKENEPSLQVIDIAFSKRTEEIINNLIEMRNGANYTVVGGLLFHALRNELSADPGRIWTVCRQATAVARSILSDDDAYFRFAHIEDDLDMIRLKVPDSATIEQCRLLLQEALDEYAIDPLGTGLNIVRKKNKMPSPNK